MNVLQWTARVLGMLLVLMLLAFAIGEGVPNPAKASGKEAMQLAGMAVMALGLVAAWKWPVAGGLATVAGWGLFQAVEVSANQRLAMAWPFTLMLVAGALHIVSSWRGHAPAHP